MIGNRLISRTITKAPGVEGTSTESYLYDGLNRLTKGTNDVSVVERRYDSLSRLIEEVQDGKSVQYGYDKVGNPTSIRYPNQRLVEREFDLLNRVSRVKQGSDVISTMEFLGRSYRLASKGYQNGDLVKYLYDQGRRLVNSETKNKNNAILQSFGWGYDVLDLKSFEKRIHSGGKGDAFSYDALKRLTNVTFDSPTPETPTATGTRSRAITLDKLDNILKITDNENAMVTEIIGELEGKGKALNQYSKFNDLPLEYDTNGNLSAKGSRLFAYDYKNRLIRSSKGDDVVTFTYDIFGRQTSRTDISGTQNFFYAGDQKIEERNASGQITKQYVWGNGIDELLRLDIYNGSSSTPYYVHTDNIGSTTAITDGNGNLVERITYDSYGVPAFTDALGQTLKKSVIPNTTLFQGREYDYDLALYNYRARYYDPTMGRFLQTDPLGYQDSMNLYQGMGMNPVNFVDPWGEAKIRVFINKSSGEVLSQKSITIPQHWDDGKIVAARTITFPSRDWTALSKLAQEKGHSLEMIYNDSNQFQYQEFRKSIGADVANEEETWTFIISHSLEVTEECLNQFDEKSRPNIPKRAMSFGDNKDPYLGGAVFKLDEDRKLTYVKDTSDNSYIGFLGCRTNDVSKNFVYGKVGTFFIEGFGQDSDRYSAINAGYGVIEALITGKNPREAANIGTIMIRRYSEVLDLYNNKILKQHVPNSEVNYGHQIIYKKTK